MNNAGIISEIWSAMRVNIHGKVNSLSGGFNLGGKPFSIFLFPTTGRDGVEILPVKLLADEAISNCPIVIGDWCPLSIVEIGDCGALYDFDIYWGRGY